MPNIGILAYGSLTDEPGPEIQAALLRVVPDVVTPFNVEFARKSKSRGYAPTLIPVHTGGAPVPAQILLLKDNVVEDQAHDMIWRRETRNIGSGKRYLARANPSPNMVVIKRVAPFHGIDVVLYTHIGANIEPLTPETLAHLTIDSVASAQAGKDGISYLIAALERGTRTELSESYAAEIMRLVGVETLPDALCKLQRSAPATGGDV